MSEDLSKIPPKLIPAVLAKLEAETAAATAEAKLHLADARNRTALARSQEFEATAVAIGLEREQEKRARERASDYDIRFYRYFKPVTESSAQHCMASLAQWYRLDKAAGVDEPHYKIQFNSPGGSVTDGMALFDEIQHFRRQGVKITTSTIGMAASMAGILLQAGDVRVMAPESWLMIHRVSFGAVGQTFEIEDRVAWIKKVEDRVLDIFAARAAASDAKKPITRAGIKRNWDRKDWWISSDEALEHGLVDAVR